MSDLIDVVEAAYRLDLDDQAWLTNLMEHAAPHLDAGLGIAGILFGTNAEGAVENRAILARGKILEDVAVIAAIGADAGPDVMKRLMWRGGCNTASQILGLPRFRRMEAFRTHGFVRGYLDWMQVNAVDPTRVGCMLGAPMPETGPVIGKRREAWDRVAAHVAAGVRLRIVSRAAMAPDVEAVLDERGHAVDAQGEATSKGARTALRDAATSLDRARGRMRKTDPQQALAAWRALVSGRWSLVDHFDHDGRRFLVARRNNAAMSDPRALSERERQAVGLAALGHPNKVIAYALGISVSRVGSLLCDAARKLGASSRVELVTMVRALGGMGAARDAPQSAIGS